jgi:hypothetical protein
MCRKRFISSRSMGFPQLFHTLLKYVPIWLLIWEIVFQTTFHGAMTALQKNKNEPWLKFLLMVEDYNIVDVSHDEQLSLELEAYGFCSEPIKLHDPL